MENNLQKAMEALVEFYGEYGSGRSLEYTFGFMDALAVLRDLDTNRQIQREHRDTLAP